MNHLQYLEKEKEEVEETIRKLKIKKELQKGNNFPIEMAISSIILVFIGGSFCTLGLVIIGLYLATRGMNQWKIKKIEKEINGYRYVKIGINKEIRKAQANPLKIEEQLDLFYDCGANIKLLNQKKFLYNLKEKYCSINPEEIEDCVYTLARKKEK